MQRFLFALLLALSPGIANADSDETRVGDTFDAMIWCLEPSATPLFPVQVQPQTNAEWLRVDVEGLEFTLMWQPQPTTLSFTNVPHYRDSRLRIGFPDLLDRSQGQTDVSREDKDMLQDFMIEAVGCFSMSDVTPALSL
jgi:hypothetical protein